MFINGPKSKNIELTDREQIQIIEAYEEAEECLETNWSDDDYLFEPLD